MNEYMEVAKLLADINLYTNVGGPFGACVVKDGEIVGKGSNHVLSNNDSTAHAEIVAIRDACKNLNTHDLSGCELYTSCYPCPMCLAAIIWSNIKKVYYGNNKMDAEKIGFRDNFIYEYFNKISNGEEDNSVIELKCIDRDKTLESFKEYEAKKDKEIY